MLSVKFCIISTEIKKLFRQYNTHSVPLEFQQLQITDNFAKITIKMIILFTLSIRTDSQTEANSVGPDQIWQLFLDTPSYQQIVT